MLIAAALLLAALDKPQQDAIDKVFAGYDHTNTPGCAAGVLHGGEIVYGRGYGLASLEHRVPIGTETIFDIGSDSKQFTAAAILLLEQQGKLSLDDDVRKYVSELPDYGAKVTIRHLLHHTSGLRDYNDLLFFAGHDEADVTNDADALAILARQKKLNFTPGTQHSYSNSGYFLLSVIVKRVSGKSLREFAREQIFAPLGMTSTLFLDDHTEVIPHRATGYTPAGEGRYAVEMSNWEQMGDGAVQTSLADMARWDANFDTGKVGGKALIDALQTTGTLTTGEHLTYASGLNVDTYRSERRVSHGGAWAGYRAFFLRLPDRGASIAVLCNDADTNTQQLALDVADVLIGPKKAGEPKIQRTPPASAPGVYVDPVSGSSHRLDVVDGRLVTGNAPTYATLEPGEHDRWSLGHVSLTFRPEGGFDLVDANGHPRRYVRAAEPVADLAPYAGTYTSEELGASYRFVVRDGRLWLQPPHGSEVELRPQFRDGFSGFGATIAFTRDASGKVDGFTLSNRGVWKLPFRRM